CATRRIRACAISARPITRTARSIRFVDQIGRTSGFARDDPASSRLEKLEALLAQAPPPDEDGAFLADLLSLPGSERNPLPNLSPRRKKERTLEALIHQLEDLARTPASNAASPVGSTKR